MRELAVFYCPKCGHYAYYQTSRHPQCPKCGCEEAMYIADALHGIHEDVLR